MVKNMQHLEEVCHVTLVSEDNERIRAHKVVLPSVSTPSGTPSRLMTRIHVLNWSILKCFVYNGDSTVNERNFLKFFKVWNLEIRKKGNHQDGELLTHIVQFPVSELKFHFQQSCEALVHTPIYIYTYIYIYFWKYISYKYSALSNFSASSVSCQWSVVKLAGEGLVICVAYLSSLTC